jgi:hypothetical protein
MDKANADIQRGRWIHGFIARSLEYLLDRPILVDARTAIPHPST